MKYLIKTLFTLLFVAGLIHAQTARLQVIHNAADPAAETVDIYLNDSLLVDNFSFRSATAFIEAPANQVINVGVAGGESASVADTLANFPLNLAAEETYIAVANGVLDPMSFETNPDGRSTGFGLIINAMGQESAAEDGVDFFALHGATDAPTVDVIARGVATLVNDAAYGDFTPYINVPAAPYILDVTPGNDNNTIVASFNADLSNLEGGAAAVFASGFLSPDNDNNGEAFGLFAALPSGVVVPFDPITARVQVIHNAADPAAASVDVYLDGALLLDDFDFRAASPFIDAPAGRMINVGIALSSSESAADTLVNFPLLLTEDETYVVVANGLLGDGFEANPDERDTGFGLIINALGQEIAASDGVDFFALHGATDAPTVDVVARGVATLVNDAAYGDFTPYTNVPAASYILDVTPGDDNNTIVASFNADLSGLEGGAAAVFASGFLSPDNDNNGEAFGLFAALPTGDVVAFDPITARLQVIHNAADTAAASVDVYLDGAILLDDFDFRSASPFIDAPAGRTINVGIALSNSETAADTLVNFPLLLTEDETYIAVANGLLGDSYEENPDDRSTGFGLIINAMAQETAAAGGVDFFALHGATDAPTVDIVARGVATLVNDAAYGDFTPYTNVNAASYILDVTPGDDNSTIVASFAADLSSLEGGAAAVFASGFLSPENDNNGEAFGLFAALPSGDVVTFEALTTARLQIIHNAADPAAASVDIYLNSGELPLLDDFAFREATEFINAPANQVINVGVAPATSNAAADTLVNFALNLLAGETYIAVASGVLDTMSFEANPDGRSTAFGLIINAMGQEEADSSGVDFFVVHGATDAPTVDVIARDVITLVDNAAYGDFTLYTNVPAASYILDVTPGNDNNTIVASFTADLSGLEGGAAAVFASGFLSPENDNNGEAFGLFAALPSGVVVPFEGIITSLREVSNLTPQQFSLKQNYPNPFNPGTKIEFNIPAAQNVSLTVYDVIGREVAELLNENLESGTYSVDFNASQLPSGIYFYRLQTQNYVETKRMTLIK